MLNKLGQFSSSKATCSMTHSPTVWLNHNPPRDDGCCVCVCVFFICIHSVWSDISSCTILDEVYKKMGCKTLSLRKRWRGDFRCVER